MVPGYEERGFRKNIWAGDGIDWEETVFWSSDLRGGRTFFRMRT